MKVSLERYIVTPDGQIFDKQNNNQLVKTFKSNKYLQCCIFDENGKHVMGVHNVVAQALLDDWFDGCVVHHKDNNQHNNNVANLECLDLANHTRLHFQEYFDTIKICPNCKKQFVWSHTAQSRYYRSNHKGTEPFCSKKCATQLTKFKYALNNGNPNAKPIACVETNTIYPSCTFASEILMISYSSLTQHLHGKLKSAQGYHFVFI